MAESLRGGLSLGLGGFGFWSHDIGGFEGTPPAGLFKRWVAFGLLSSHSRLHGSSSHRVPWAFGDEAVEVTRAFARLKNSLMPYLWGAAVQAHAEGIPVLRAMVLEFPDDRTCAYLDRQYMLGGDLLVAPVFCDDGDVEVYVPAGEWTDWWDGGTVRGPGWVRQRHGFGSLPLLVRPGAVIALGRGDRPDYDDAVSPTFAVFGAGGTARLFGAAGEERVRVEAARDGDRLTASVVSGELAGEWTLRSGRGPSVSGSGRELELRIP
jgi:alpha-D-xyloside xylohydrolase